MCIKFKIDTLHAFIDIEAIGQMFTQRQTDGWTYVLHLKHQTILLMKDRNRVFL